jgi:serine phosphatase RsbU (regulator of sigma subunit)
VDDAAGDERVDPGVVRAFGMKSFLSVPLKAQGRVLGTVVLQHRSSAVPFNDAQLDFARRLQSVVALALENAKLYERERRIADTLQEAILAPLPHVDGLESANLYRPASSTANVGGDFYDMFELDDGKVAIVVGDVSGKGIEAARLTSLLRDAIRAYALETENPARTLERVNELVRRSSPVDAFATVFLGVLDVNTGWLLYTSAGHPPALVCTGSQAEFLAETPASIVGAFSGAKYGFGEAQLEPGEVLVLYTDGVLEARAGAELFGEKRLLAAVEAVRDEPLDRMPEALVDKVLEFADGHLRDDTVVMCVRWDGPRSKG